MIKLFDYFTDVLGENYWAGEGGAPGDTLVEMFYGQLDDVSDVELPKAFKEDASICRCLIATCAFGMGMEVKDVEYVLHWGPPSNFLQYWQEVGRAGRDGRLAKAIMYIPPYTTDKRRVEEDMLEMVSGKACLRMQVLSALQLPGMTDSEIAKCCKTTLCCMVCDKKVDHCDSTEN